MAGFSPDTILEDLTARHPQTLRVLQRFGIECTQAMRSALGQACRDHRLPYAPVALALAFALSLPREPEDWAVRSLSDQTRHVTTVFHQPLRSELARLQAVVMRIQGHGNAHRRALVVILHELARKRTEAEAHMRAEERELFPLIDALAAGEPCAEGRGRFFQLRSAIEAEHVDAAQTLRMFEQLTDGYRPPAGTCAMVHELYRGLEELQTLERSHAAFERDILFPLAWNRLGPQDG
jgi:regulator of cell morphogenesis and NO signaling